MSKTFNLKIRKFRLVNPLFKNVSANLIGVGWNGLLIILATPWYVSRLGMEGYGLVGFWLLLQIVLGLFDLGLGATLVREFAVASGRPESARRRRDLLRTLEYVYWTIGLFFAVIVFISAGWFANHWLKLNAITPVQAARSIRWMALALGLQFPNMLYSSGLAGLQCQGRMNLLQMVGNTLRHGGGVAILLWRADPVGFFIVQTFAAGVQTLATWSVLWRLLGEVKGKPPAFRLDLLKEVWRFSAGMAATMVAGVLLTYVDRMFLSKLLPAAELGKYTLSWTVASFLQMGIQPFYRAYFPRFAELFALGESERLRNEYYQGCRLTAGVIIPISLIGWMFAPQIFLAWLGSADGTVVQVFRWLLLGVAGAGLMWLPAAFQQAQGWTSLHAMMISGALAVGVPCLWWSIRRWGAVGATAVWVLHGVSDITLGLWLMHRRLLRNELPTWLHTVILPPLLFGLSIVGLSRTLMPARLGRWPSVVWLGVTGLLVISSLFLFEGIKTGKLAKS